jgi:hypothetical protein
MNDEQFQEAMNERREMHNLSRNDHVIGCPLCLVIPEEVSPDAQVERAEKKVEDARTSLEEAEAAAEAARAAAEAAGGQQ